MGETANSQRRAAIPATASLRVDPERIERMWSMRPDERIRAARDGQFTLGEMLRWASRRPSEVELVDGEFWFITADLADCEDDSADTSPVDARKVSRDTSRTRMAAARDTSGRWR